MLACQFFVFVLDGGADPMVYPSQSYTTRSPFSGTTPVGFRRCGSEFRVQGSGFRVQGSGFRVQGPGFRVQGSGFRVQGSGCKVQGSGCEDLWREDFLFRL